LQFIELELESYLKVVNNIRNQQNVWNYLKNLATLNFSRKTVDFV